MPAPMSLLLGVRSLQPSESVSQSGPPPISQQAAVHLGLDTSPAIFSFKSPRPNSPSLPLERSPEKPDTLEGH